MSLPDADAERLSLAGKMFRPTCVRCGGAKKIEGVKTIAKVMFLYSMYIPSLSRRDRNRRTLNKMEGDGVLFFETEFELDGTQHIPL